MIVPKDDERKKAQKATKPAFGLGNVSGSATSRHDINLLVALIRLYIIYDDQILISKSKRIR